MQRLRIVTAEERLSAAHIKTSLAIFGPPGVGKTTLLKTLPASKTVCLDLEAGMKSVQDWAGASIPVRSFTDFRDLAVLIGGADPAAHTYYSECQPQMLPIGDLLPDGTFAKIRMTIRPGGVDGSAPMDRGLLKASASSDAKLLDCEFTIVEGPFARRKFWQTFTVAGGKVDDKGGSKGWNIAKATFRAMIDSALGLDWNDLSSAAKAKRQIQGLKQLDGITFAGRIMIEPASSAQYKDAGI